MSSKSAWTWTRCAWGVGGPCAQSTGNPGRVKHACLSLQRMLTCLLPGMLGKAIVYNLVVFAVCRANLHLNPPEYCSFQTFCFLDLLQTASLSIKTSLEEMSLVLDKSLRNFYVVLGPRQSGLPQGPRSPQPFSLHPYPEHCF